MQTPTMPSVVTVREHKLVEDSLTKEDIADLKVIAGSVFKHKNGRLQARNYVGIVTTGRGTVIEILPKIDLGGETADYEKTRDMFLKMLRCWRRLKRTKALPRSSIRAIRRFPMLEIFFHQFLVNVNMLARGGLARRYIAVEENLPYMRGRILFRQQLLDNIANQARFFVAHDELSANRPANRLIHTALTRIGPRVLTSENRKLLRQLMPSFAEVPQAADPHADWRKHHIDRTMRHYGPVMQWVGLFLFNQGLTTFSGRHANLSLLFPMEQVFEDFVTDSFRRYQDLYAVGPQKPQKKLAEFEGKDAFTMKPDISLMEKGQTVVYILDAKWKEVNQYITDNKHNIEQDDMYQLYAYGKCYECDAVALVYPRNRNFTRELRYAFFDGLPLVCLPFDIARPKESVRRSVKVLRNFDKATKAANGRMPK